MRDIIGIVGGMGAYAGTSIFERLVKSSPASSDQDFIEIIVHNNSKIPDRTKGILNEGESPVLELLRSVKILENAGATKIILGCITAHYYCDVLQKELKNAKIINIVDETVSHVLKIKPNIKSVGIISSRGTAKTEIWQKAFKNCNISLHFLSDQNQRELFDQVIYGVHSIKAGYFDESNSRKIKTAINLLKMSGAELVIGSCSELPLVLPEEFSDNYIDSIGVVINKIISDYYQV